jgi:hypothetical protein
MSNYLRRIVERYGANHDAWIRNGDFDLLQAHFNEIERHQDEIEWDALSRT